LNTNFYRLEDDGLQQTFGRHESYDGATVPVEGSARILIMPDDEQRPERIEEARQWLSELAGDENWLVDEEEEAFRLLVS
jgi:DNA helicase-2/ATP-dependent DNA helicase PcrA